MLSRVSFGDKEVIQPVRIERQAHLKCALLHPVSCDGDLQQALSVLTMRITLAHTASALPPSAF